MLSNLSTYIDTLLPVPYLGTMCAKHVSQMRHEKWLATVDEVIAQREGELWRRVRFV